MPLGHWFGTPIRYAHLRALASILDAVAIVYAALTVIFVMLWAVGYLLSFQGSSSDVLVGLLVIACLLLALVAGALNYIWLRAVADYIRLMIDIEWNTRSASLGAAPPRQPVGTP
jgi:RsiW-degrading membrane proteinase PrsW (M82 family)